MKNKKWILLSAILFIFHIGHTYAKTKHIPARCQHSAIYDSANKQMLIWGGNGQGVPISDLLVYDIEKNTWKEIEPEGVRPAGQLHSAIYDSANKQMIIFGGIRQDGILLYDLWAFDIEKNTWKEIEPAEAPAARLLYSIIYDSTNKQMLLWGGDDGLLGALFSDLWAFDIEKKKWEEIKTDESPPARSSHSAIYDSANKQMLIFGGFNDWGDLSDLWAYDIEKKTWEKIKTKKTPPARSLHSAIYDSTNKQMLIFGGRDRQGGRFSDLWTFDTEKKTWEKIKTNEGPSARSCHSAIYDPVNKQMLVFGGSGQAIFSDLWAYDIEKKTWEKLKPKYEKD